MREFTLVTFFTPEYQDCIGHLRAAAYDFDAEELFLPFESSGDWNKNTQKKTEALVWARHAAKGPILYVDADTKFVSRPRLPKGAWDVGLVTNPRAEHKNTTSSQFIWFEDSLGARRFIHWWDFYVKSLRSNDHPLLTKTILFCKTHPGIVKLVDADEENRDCWIMNGQRPGRSQATRIKYNGVEILH